MTSKKSNVKSNNMKKRIKHHWELEVHKMSMDASMRIFSLTKKFPNEERYSLTDQVRRSSRSVSSNIAEAWRKRRYMKFFICKLNDSEAAETLVWLEYSVKCE